MGHGRSHAKISDKEAAARLLIWHPAQFARAVGFDLLTDDLHGPWIREMVCGKRDVTLQAHRGSYKTSCISVAIPIVMLTSPQTRIFFFRKTDGDVKEVLRQIRKVLEHDVTRSLARVIWGRELVLTTATTTEITTNLLSDAKGTAQLTGMGIGGSVTGKHCDLCFTDDIVNVKDRVSRAERETTKRFYMELQNIVNRGGRRFNSGTPWHEEDAFSIMPDPERYDCYSTGLISTDELATIRRSMVPSLFAANYELRHIPIEAVLFTDPQVGGDPAKVEQASMCHVDAAYGGDDSTAFTIARKVDGKIYVFGKLWEKHVEKCEDEIISLRQRFKAGAIRCEDNADKGFLAKELRVRGERVITYTEGTNKYIKISSYLLREWENIVFVDGTDAAYIRQITDYNEEAEHDDAPDSLASCIRALWYKKDEGKQTPTLYGGIFGG